MKYIVSSISAALLLVMLLAPLQRAQAVTLPAFTIMPARQNKIDNALSAKLNSIPSGDMVTVIVQLRQRAILPDGKSLKRSERLSELIGGLKRTADVTQGPVIRLLKLRQKQGTLIDFKPFWIINGFSVTANTSTINEIARLPDVLSITSDVIDIVPVSSAYILSNPEQNISLISAPSLWNLGYTGQGVVIASLDSGVDLSHPELASRWRGGTNSWFDPFGQHPVSPVDMSGHGTWTMGVMLGGDAGGTSIGVAPGAQWIATRIFDDQGGSTATAIHQSYQWLLDPDNNPATADAPQIVNNSWDFVTPGCNLEFELDLQVLRAAGILPVFAAGNSGPFANTSHSPANNPSAFAIGAINNNSLIYGQSSRGPTTCGGSTGPFPDLAAPGVNVNTTDLGGFYTTTSGTSISAPHVSGGLALLLSAYPNLPASQQESALRASAIDLGTTGPDDIYGYGRLDLFAAYQWLATAPTETPTPLPTATNDPVSTATPTLSAMPSVVSSALADLNPTLAASVDFTVTFSETVTGVDASDFSLTTSGVSGATVSGVSGSGSIYTVTATTGTGAGTIRLDILDDDSIVDTASNPLGGVGAGNSNFTLGETYSIRVATFDDVPITHWSWQLIERLYSASITGGCGSSPLIYCPDSSVTRAQMAIFLLRGIHGSTYTPPVATGTIFTDVPASYWAAAWIEQLYAENITSGCGVGIYCPDNAVTRAQMAIFLLKAEHGSSYTPPTITVTQFTDVPVSYWAAAWIEQLAVEGITSGCSVGVYCPDSPVTRAAMAVFLVKTFNLP